jgi:hypothetical protein
MLFPVPAFPRADRLVDDNEYKDKDFHKGIITDYNDMVKGDDIDWVWVKDGVKLGNYKVKVESIENKSDSRNKSFVQTVRSLFEDYFGSETKGTAGTLAADLCITEVQNFSPGKAWIPFAGGHQMQAGMGIEVVLRDANKNIVAKIRHFAREGTEVKQAAEEVASDVAKYIRKH